MMCFFTFIYYLLINLILFKTIVLKRDVSLIRLIVWFKRNTQAYKLLCLILREVKTKFGSL